MRNHGGLSPAVSLIFIHQLSTASTLVHCIPASDCCLMSSVGLQSDWSTTLIKMSRLVGFGGSDSADNPCTRFCYGASCSLYWQLLALSSNICGSTCHLGLTSNSFWSMAPIPIYNIFRLIFLVWIQQQRRCCADIQHLSPFFMLKCYRDSVFSP